MRSLEPPKPQVPQAPLALPYPPSPILSAAAGVKYGVHSQSLVTVFPKSGCATVTGTAWTEVTNWSLTVRTSSHPCVRELITSPVLNVPLFVFPRLGSVMASLTALTAETNSGVETRRVCDLRYGKFCHRENTKFFFNWKSY